MSIRWRIFCTDPDDIGWHEVWSDTPPTVCPNDAGHSVNLNSYQELDLEEELLRFNPNVIANNVNYERILKFSYNPDIYGTIRRFKLLAYQEGNLDDFSIRVSNATTVSTLLEESFSNTDEVNIITTGEISVSPSVENVIEIDIKRNGGNKASKIYIDEIIVLGIKN